MEQAITSAEEQHARDLLKSIELSVETEYESLLFHRKTTIERRKAELKNIITLAITHLDEEYQHYRNGNQSLQQAQQHAIQAINSLRYDEGIGYIWINDLGQPIPRMIMHPTLPELDGKLLDDPIFNTALGINKNLFVAMVDLCLKHGEGFVDYLWPKPTIQGLSKEQPKISYVRLFEQWNWVIGTGVYINDIEAETQRRLDAIIDELNTIFAKVKLAETGYMFLFNGQREMLVHPNITGAEFAPRKNPVTGAPLFDELVAVAKTPGKPLDYEWDKPGFEGQFRFPKRTFVTYFEPLDWYIGASMYTEELAQPGKQLRKRILFLGLGSLFVTFLIAIALSRRLSKPLRDLAQSAKEIEEQGLAVAKIPISGATEIRELGQVLEQMVTSLSTAEEKRINLEKQMLHVQKLESLGVLAGGIAHDFNNILLAITGNADMALRRISKDASPVEHLQRIKQAVEKAAALARQMLAYSGKGKFLVESLDLNQLLEEMLPMLEISISKNAALHLSLTKPLPAVEADGTQLRQIILNLVINASEAIADQNGEITIITSCATCSKNDLYPAWRNEDFRQGEYLCLEITDTGCGMNKETLTKLFDPFFTTKFTGRGLGMSAVQGIVRSHHGGIKVSSEPGQGSSFKVLLPASGKPVEIPDSVPPPDDWTGTGKVLLVDDEETVRSIGREMLEELGFSVITANDGREALAVYRSTAGISFVILDLTMPQMNGEQCLRELQQINPDIKVIMSSGYSELADTQKLTNQGLVGFIQKPYWLNTLRDTIRKVT